LDRSRAPDASYARDRSPLLMGQHPVIDRLAALDASDDELTLPAADPPSPILGARRRRSRRDA
jgi:hypothetical protein